MNTQHEVGVVGHRPNTSDGQIQIMI